MAHDIIKLVAQLSDSQLLELGRRGAATDYAVRFFHHKSHPRFYHNRTALLRAVRRAMSINFPDTKAALRERALEMLGLRMDQFDTGAVMIEPAPCECSLGED